MTLQVMRLDYARPSVSPFALRLQGAGASAEGQTVLGLASSADANASAEGQTVLGVPFAIPGYLFG